MVSNNTTQESILQSNNTPLMLATSYNPQITACNSNYKYTQQATFTEGGQDDMQEAKDEDTDNCEHNYHILEQPIMDNDYEELDKYEKKGRSQQEKKDVSYTVPGPAVEGEGPEGGVCTSTNDSTSEEHDKSVLISKYGN